MRVRSSMPPGSLTGWVNIVDDGGKITPHHNVFFMAADGSQMAGADITSDQPVRFVTEFADVSHHPLTP